MQADAGQNTPTFPIVWVDGPLQHGAWKLTLLDTRRNPVFAYDPYDDSYQAIPLSSSHTVYISPGAGPGSHQVVVQRDPFDDLTGHIVLGLVTGMAAGVAMRSFLWMPFFFC
uniref:Uncharacterized protein n=1 Tax=Knipowitschia caucasica TaxID=637954 RepID=A0AAV2J824_KNICA